MAFKVFVLSGFLLANPPALFAANTDSSVADKLERMDSRYQSLSSKIYKNHIKKNKQTILRTNDINKLEKTVRSLNTRLNHIAAISHIKTNLQTIRNNIYDKSVLYFLALLLNQNERLTAEKLYDDIKYEDDRFLVSNASYLFAKYHFKRNQWQQTIKLLSGISEDLSVDDTHYTYIIHGIALQRLKKHRKAIPLYEKVPATSKYYIYARLNLAVAFIRQDWWTDAHIVISDLLKNESVKKPEEMINRLYLVLGYSLLSKDYYRDAREAFRNVSLESRYTSRALLGISLAATSQGDYVGALNTLTILKDRRTVDLPVDEAYILLPYVYENLNQQVTASAGYTAAIEYYQTRIADIQITLNDDASNYIDDALRVSENTFLVDGNIIEFEENESEALLKNLYRADSLQRIASQVKDKQELIQLKKEYKSSLDRFIRDSLGKKITYLDSYLNQARYGLARLYDSSNNEQ